MEAYKERLIKEQKELKEKLASLIEFINSDKFYGLSSNNRGAGVNGVLDMESQINDNNNAWAREAITNAGNRSDFAISQLSQNLGVG